MKSDKVARARRETLELIETEGIRAAARAAIEVCRDTRATPQARSSAASTLMRAAGLGGFGKAAEADRSKELHEMTYEEMTQEAAEGLARLQQYRLDDEDPEDDSQPSDSIFS